MRANHTLALLLAAMLTASRARAGPEWNGGVVTSLCGVGESAAYFTELAWCNALHGDVLFGRRNNRGLALGPYLEVSTRSFEDVRWGGGASLLLPVLEDFPLVLSIGPYLNGVSNAGVKTSLFWGLRTYNFHGAYGMAAGFVLGAEHDFGARPANALAAGLQLDALWLALPFVVLYQWIRGP